MPATSSCVFNSPLAGFVEPALSDALNFKNKSLRNAMFAHVHECMHDPSFMRNFVGQGRMTKDKCLGLSGRTKSGFNTCMATTLLGVHHLGELICDRKNLPCEFHFPSSFWEVTSLITPGRVDSTPPRSWPCAERRRGYWAHSRTHRFLLFFEGFTRIYRKSEDGSA